MSTCPSKDIHSVYLDNELPEIYKAEYEAHLKECKKCQDELAKIRKLHEMFNSDSSAITPDSHYMEQSFERLQMKMKFSKNTQRQSAPVSKFNVKNVGYIGMAAAAAAVFAFVIPLRLNGTNNSSASSAVVASVMPAHATNVSFDNSGKSMVISGNIDESVLYSGSAVNSALIRNVSTNSVGNTQLSLVHNNEVELLRPELETISIKITLPGMGAVPVTTEVTVPVDVVSGRY